MDLQWWVLLLCSCMYVCICSGHGVVYQVCAEDCERLIVWRSGAMFSHDFSKSSTATQRKTWAGQKTATTKNLMSGWERSNNDVATGTLANRSCSELSCGGRCVLTKKKKDKHTIKHECWPGIPQKVLRRRRWCRASYKWLCVILQLP